MARKKIARKKTPPVSAWVRCVMPGCSAYIPDHHWGREIKTEWFHDTDDSFCPRHIPSWVVQLRKEKSANS